MPTVRAILRTPGRTFPAVVIQGDSLSILYDLAEKVAEEALLVSGNSEFIDAAAELRDLLRFRIELYENGLRH
jgi:hypothetical protein